MEIVCFSFNRGRLLKNAVLSARFCSPASKITVYDDGSDDAETVNIIRNLKLRFNIRVITPNLSICGIRGGLHKNIKEFIAHHAIDKYVLLMQDDTQFFRVLDKKDFDFIESYFMKKLDSIFLYPLVERHRLEPRKYNWSDETNTYLRLPSLNYSGYSAVCIVNVARARENLDIFGDSEGETSHKAALRIGSIAHMTRPFLVYLPAPYTVRGKDDAIISKWWRTLNTGVHPVSLLTSRDVERLFQNPKKPPCANDDLDAPSFGSGNGWPAFHLQGAPKWLRLLDLIERRLRQQVRKIVLVGRTLFAHYITRICK